MDVIENFDDLCSIEPCQRTIDLPVFLQYVEQLSKLQVVFEHVEVVLVLIDTVQVADEGMVHLCHVLYLIVDVLLLLSFKHFVFGDDLQCIHLLTFVCRSEGR